IVIGFNVPNILNNTSNEEVEEGTKLLIVDSSDIFSGSLNALNDMELGYSFDITNEYLDFEQIKEKIANEEISEALIITNKNGKVNMEYVVKNLLYVEKVPESLVSAISSIYTNMQISKLNLTQEQIAGLTPNFEFEFKQTEEKEVQGNPVVMMLLSLVLFYAIYFCAYQVSSSITTEKTSKIIETLVTSTKPSTIVLGKTIGIGIIGLMQILLIIVTAIISSNLFLPEGMLSGIINLDNMTPYLLVITILYFLLGYFTYALLYALTGSTVSKPEDVQSANGPVAILAVIGFYLAYFTMMNPTSSLNAFAALFPISSPFCMPLRVMMGVASLTDVILSIGILIITIFVIAKVSIKIYSNAILNYGKSGIKDIMKMYKQK
ncbi:MAG: ABC transporter permease, partial [Clostridia bacterium]|nr:ABC transporter permease [Clostridia bacterium]